MIALVYSLAGTPVRVFEAGDRWELRRLLAESYIPGRSAFVASGPRARKADLYYASRARRQWLRGERVVLSPSLRADMGLAS
jgi:hypothetical protein